MVTFTWVGNTVAGLLHYVFPFHWLVTFFRFAHRQLLASISTTTSSMSPSSGPNGHTDKDNYFGRSAEQVEAASLRKRSRTMIHLKTKEECRLINELIDVWTVELPSKHAERILKIVKEFIPGQDSIDLQHLRRFAKPKYLPQHVLVGQTTHAKNMCAVPRSWGQVKEPLQNPTSTTWTWTHSDTPVHKIPTLYLIICPTKIIPEEDLFNLLRKYAPFTSDSESWAYPLELKRITVPLLAPTTQAQANSWSEKYWPTFYRKTNPFGAHPTTIEKAEDELQEPKHDQIGVDGAFELAEAAAGLVEGAKDGAAVGCVIIERSEGEAKVIAVAGDARDRSLPAGDGRESRCQGNVMAHAVMRAIGMVGRKRLRVASTTVRKDADKAEGNFATVGLTHDVAARDAFFVDLPINDLEQRYFDEDNIKPDGYLCLKLEIFTTHEPCMMCSMALVHSRVGRVIFKHRMPSTGGLTAEKTSNTSGPVGLGYGLCWRKELNWQFMCWEYRPTTPEEDCVLEAARESKERDSTQVAVRSKGEQSKGKDRGVISSFGFDGVDERDLDDRAEVPEHHASSPGEKSYSHEHKADIISKRSFAGINV